MHGDRGEREDAFVSAWLLVAEQHDALRLFFRKDTYLKKKTK